MATASIDRYISNSKGDRIKLQLVRKLTRDRCCIQKLSLFSIIFRFLFSLRFQAGPFVLLHDQYFVLLLVESSRFYYLYQVGFIVLIYLLNLLYLIEHLSFKMKVFKLLV